MYIKNRRNSSKIKDFGSYQAFFLTEKKGFEIAYFSYTNRYLQAKNDDNDKK